MKNHKTLRRVLGTAMAAAMLAGISVPAAAADISIEVPDEPMSVETTDGTRYLTTTAQRASSEIPLILGVNVIGGNLFNGAIVMSGTDINDNPDPYIWNFNYLYLYDGLNLSGAQFTVSEETRRKGTEDFDMSIVYDHGLSTGTETGLGNGGMANGNGLYSSGGANQVFSTALEALGGVSYGVYHMIDCWIGFNSDVLDQIDFIQNEMDMTSEYYQEGYATYDPMITDVSTGTVTARAYAWVEMGEALSAYLEEHPNLSARYGDPKALCYNIQEFAFGIPYYIDSLIDTGALTKITGACISATDDAGVTFTLIDPATAGDVRGDAYAVGNTVNWLTGTYTMDQILAAGVDVLVIYAAGYTYVEGGTGGGSQGSGSYSNTLTRAYLEELMEDAGCTYEEAPVIIDAENKSVTAGDNGYNYAPTTPLYVPYIVAYMYMEQLAALAEAGDDVAAAINPTAMFEYACDEFFHIKDDAADTIALYWIADKWDATDSELDKVPDTTDYTYNKDAVVTAIQTGIQYALDNVDNDNIYLNGAYRENETGYKLAHLVTDNGYDSFLEILNAASDYSNVEGYDVSALVAYYGTSGLAELVDNYAAHMESHAWQPDTSIEGTYGYGMAAAEVTESDTLATGDANGDGSVTTMDAVLALRCVNNTVELLDNQIEALDVNGNGLVETNDAVYILQYVTRITTAFPKDSK
ncbi:MAG: dockerin type I repeat-containing protein [Oscillospiraceae bacterium]|nr:dockerin type I repeat-containing protein [Oscillospiraceae bacterium]